MSARRVLAASICAACVSDSRNAFGCDSSYDLLDSFTAAEYQWLFFCVVCAQVALQSAKERGSPHFPKLESTKGEA